MILIWRGAGILVAPIAVVSFFGGIFLADALFGENIEGRVRALTSCWLAAALTLPLALLLRRPSTPPTGKPTDPEAMRYEPHDLFFVPLSFWPGLFFVFGIACYFGMASKGRL